MPCASAQGASPEERRAFTVTSQVSWALTAALLLFVIGAILTTSIEFRRGVLPLNAVVGPIFGLVGFVYIYLRFDITVAGPADAIALAVIFTSVAAAYTYVMTYLGAGAPLWDARFAAADRALGLDWRAYLAWLNERPVFGWALDQAYLSILKQIPCLVVLLALLGQHRRLQIFILASQLCLIVCGAGGCFLPALGIYEFLNVSAAVDHPNIALATTDQHVAQVLQLRGPAPFIQLGEIEGIIVFPSFHMALAVLFAWGFWGMPVVRWIALALNLAMAAATPLSGGHYFVDLVAGAILAVAAIAAASALRNAIEGRVAGRPAAAPAFSRFGSSG
jgi:hypothetical protein